MATSETLTDSFAHSGLSSSQASLNLQKFGFNELPSAKRKSWFAIFLGVAREPMFILLLVCAFTYLLLGDLQESVLLFFSIFVVVGITLFQETKSERALEALRDLSSPRALVIRDGKELRIPGREVVPEDIVALREGDRVSADGILLASRYLRVDESLLTGESVPVTKTISGGVGPVQLFSGSMVIGGSGVFQVTATGIRTEIGKIGKSIESAPSDSTPLQREISYLVKIFGVIGLIFSSLVVLSYGATVGDWSRGFLAGIAAAMSLLPEELPVILTVFFAIGAWRISKKNVLARQVSAIENLGAVSVLCVDKTGTLTRNEMVVRSVWANEKHCPISEDSTALPDDFHETIEYGVLASHIDPFDPMEKAIKQSLENKLAGTDHVHRDWKLIREYPLSDDLLAMSCVWEAPDKSGYTIACKGAPEAILDLCHLGKNEQQKILREVREMAAQGLRILGVAQAPFTGKTLPPIQHDFEFRFKGLIGLEDPIRPEAKAAVAECYGAGIRILMMTGDYSETATSIAKQIGISNPEKVITGAELQKMSDPELKEKMRSVNVFARTVPVQKLRIINALKEKNTVIAMTGDGVNDAPSLKWADVGIAMGLRGTDVAREASDIVLLDDNFSSIVAGVKLGRRIFDNIQKAISYVLAIHVPIAGMAILPVVFKLPLVLMPIHIVFLELIIDPACSLIFEAEASEPNVMKRPPRRVGTRPFGFAQILRPLLHGLISLSMTFALYRFALSQGGSPAHARAVAFAVLVMTNLGLILGNLSWTKGFGVLFSNRILPWVLGGALLLLGLVLCVPYFKELFEFSTPSIIQLGLCLSAALVTAAFTKGIPSPHTESRLVSRR